MWKTVYGSHGCVKRYNFFKRKIRTILSINSTFLKLKTSDGDPDPDPDP